MVAIHSTHRIVEDLRARRFSLVHADEIPLPERLIQAWEDLRADYAHLPPDEFLPGGARYRLRRYDRFYFHPYTGELAILPHEDYFQSLEINTVTGGVVRRFAPLTPEIAENPFLHELIRFDFSAFPLAQAEMQYNPWQVDVHLIQIVADPGAEGHPTPEGVHRDGAEFVTVHLVNVENAEGGEVTVYDDDRQPLASFQLEQPLDSYLFEDALLWHGVTPIRSADGVHPARRGILTFDFHYSPNLLHPYEI